MRYHAGKSMMQRTRAPAGRMRPHVAAVLFGAVSMVMLGAGCEDRRLDLRNIESAMQHRYGRDIPVPIVEVACPETVRTRKGDRFDCEVTFEGGATWTIAVVQTGAGKTRWTPRGRAVAGEDIASRAAALLAGQGRQVEVRCRERVYVIEEGDRIACEVVRAGGTARLDIEVGAGDELRVAASQP